MVNTPPTHTPSSASAVHKRTNISVVICTAYICSFILQLLLVLCKCVFGFGVCVHVCVLGGGYVNATSLLQLVLV